tara:strand:- start:10 stop:189 length:180 start_codon:yes stop_codon:yes gene_type:complete
MLVDNVVPARVLWDMQTHAVILKYEQYQITRAVLLDRLENLGWDREVALDLILEDEEEE